MAQLSGAILLARTIVSGLKQMARSTPPRILGSCQQSLSDSGSSWGDGLASIVAKPSPSLKTLRQALKRRRAAVHVFLYLKANRLASGNFLPSTAAVINLVANMEKVMPLPP